MSEWKKVREVIESCSNVAYENETALVIALAEFAPVLLFDSVVKDVIVVVGASSSISTTTTHGRRARQ